jgi:hypothetical protein
MKHVKRALLLLVIIFTFSGLKYHTGAGDEFKSQEYLEVDTTSVTIPSRPIPVTSIKLRDFMLSMARLESGGILEPYHAINRYGYMGKYQFSKKTLRGLVRTGYLKATNKELRNFMRDPELQERAMVALVKNNKKTLLNYGLYRYIGREVNGVKVTMSGMLASAHLLGPYAVSHYLKNGGSLKTVKLRGVVIRKYDGNGTSLEDYMKHFENS